MSAPAPSPSNNGSIVATGGRVANTLITSLSSTPALLVMVILNIGMMAVAGWYLNNQENYRHRERLEVLRVINSCFADMRPAPHRRDEGPMP